MKAQVFAMALTALLVVSAQAADKKPADKAGGPEPTAEQRQKLAAMHEKMAACLRSDRPVRDCHKEMMDTCHDMGKDCPMMRGHGPGPMGDHHERMHGGEDAH